MRRSFTEVTEKQLGIIQRNDRNESWNEVCEKVVKDKIKAKSKLLQAKTRNRGTCTKKEEKKTFFASFFRCYYRAIRKVKEKWMERKLNEVEKEKINIEDLFQKITR